MSVYTNKKKKKTYIIDSIQKVIFLEGIFKKFVLFCVDFISYTIASGDNL